MGLAPPQPKEELLAAICALSTFPTLISLRIDSGSSILPQVTCLNRCILLWLVWSPPLEDLSSTGVLCGSVSPSEEPSRIQAYPASGGHVGSGNHHLPVSAVRFKERGREVV